jgi:hypothetical protein
MRAPTRHYPESGGSGTDFDGAFFGMAHGAENLRKRLGDTKVDQLHDMLAQSKAHYESGENELGGALLQDMEMVLIDRQPWAYPRERYRWPVKSDLPEVGDADFLDEAGDPP